jgi:hypothetical protein
MLCAALATPQLLRSHAIQQHLSAAVIQRDETFASLRDEPTNFKQLLQKMCAGGTFPTPKGCGLPTGSGFDKLYALFGLGYVDALKYKDMMITTEDKWGSVHEFKDERVTNALSGAPYKWRLRASTGACIESIEMTVEFMPKEDAEVPWEVVKHSTFFQSMSVSASVKAADAQNQCGSYLFAGYLKQSLSTLCTLGGTSAALYASKTLPSGSTGYYVWPRYGFNGDVQIATLTEMLAYLKDKKQETYIGGTRVDPVEGYTWLKNQCGYSGTECKKTVQLHTIFSSAAYLDDASDRIRNAVKAAWKAEGADIMVSFPLDPASCASPTAGPAAVAWSLLTKAVEDRAATAVV